MRSIRFELDPDVSLGDATLTYHLATFATEGLVSAARLRLEVSHRVDSDGHAIIVHGEGEPLDALLRVFTSLLTREFGERSFKVRQCVDSAPRMAAVA